jgi:hypothetical protein
LVQVLCGIVKDLIVPSLPPADKPIAFRSFVAISVLKQSGLAARRLCSGSPKHKVGSLDIPKGLDIPKVANGSSPLNCDTIPPMTSPKSTRRAGARWERLWATLPYVIQLIRNDADGELTWVRLPSSVWFGEWNERSFNNQPFMASSPTPQESTTTQEGSSHFYQVIRIDSLG